MKNSIIITLLVVFAFSCKKESNNNQKQQPDKIVYSAADTSESIYTFRFSSPSVFDCPRIPTPSDSSANLKFDIDKDSKNDFGITATHSKYEGAYSGHCSRFTYYIKIEGLEPGDSIRVLLNSDMAPLPEKLDSIIDISKNGKWSNRGVLVLSGCCYLPFTPDFSDMVIGIRKINKYGWIHIKPKAGNGIYLLDYAINMTDNNSIKSGQK